MPKTISWEVITGTFEGKKLDVLSIKNEYKTQHSKLQVRCLLCGQIVEETYRKVKKRKSQGCMSCIKKSNRKSYSQIVVDFRSQGLMLLTPKDQYRAIRDTRLHYRCECGNLSSAMYYDVVVLGKRCWQCGLEKVSGSNNYRYNSELSDEDRIKERRGPKLRKWRKEIFKRDEFTCQCCGRKGGDLNAHHLEGYAKNPSLRVRTYNGVTLCEDCHIKFHSEYGGFQGDNTMQQLIEFLYDMALQKTG